MADTIINDAELASFGVYAPDSSRLNREELAIVRYLEKEYNKYVSQPVTCLELGVSSNVGPLFLDTEELIEGHYDEDISFFSSFLDDYYRAYTMAYYGSDCADNVKLEEAQTNKFDLICRRAKVRNDIRVLNIGCGFGSLERYLFDNYEGVQVSGITPSSVQADFIRKLQQNDDSFRSGFDLIQRSFDEELANDLAKDKFDLIISIGVFEQLNNIESMLTILSDLLKPNGHSFHHFITSSIVTPQVSLENNALISRYFPGGRAWPHAEFEINVSGLSLENSWFINGCNYYRTLSEWHERYWKSIPHLIKMGFTNDRIRYWNQYFLLCKCMFKSSGGNFYGVSHYLHSKK